MFSFARPLTALALGALVLTASPGLSQPEPPQERPITPGTPSEIPLRIKEIRPDTFLITGRGGNSVVRRTPAGMILVDNKVMYAQVYRELRALIAAQVGAQPLVYAFVTHHHADHSGNDQRLMDDGVKLIGQRKLANILSSYKSRIAPVNPAVPAILFDRSYTVELGGVRAIAYHWGAAHTGADIAVYFPDERLVVAGDLLSLSGEPAIDALDGGGSLIGLRDRIDDILRLDFDVAVPGHGDNVMTRDEVVLFRNRIDKLIQRGIAAVQRGVPLERLREEMRSDDLGFRLVGHFWTEHKYLKPIFDELTLVARAHQ